MKKKVCLIIGSVLLFLIVMFALWRRQERNSIAGSVISEKKEMRLLNSLDFSEKLEYSLLFGRERVPYDAAEDRYYLPQTADPDWQREQSFSLAEEGMELFWCEDPYWGKMEEAIAEGHAFEFIVSDGKRADTGEIIFTGLPMIRLETQEILESEEDPEETYYYCKVSIFDPFHGNTERYEVVNCFGYLEMRGKTSTVFPKKGWNLSLVKENGKDYDISLFGLRKDHDWKLNALYSDSSKVRESVAMELWNELAAQTSSAHDTGTNMEYFELMMDQGYQGLYGAMEPVDYAQLSLDKTKDVLYKTYAWPREGNVDETLLDGAEDFCGNLIKNGNRTITAELWQPLKEYVNVTNFSEKQEKADLEELWDYVQSFMDPDNFMNSELFVQTLYAYDNKYKNFYIAADIDIDHEGSYTLWKIPWDMNYSFGDRYSIENGTLTLYQSDWSEEIMKEFMLSESFLESGNREFTILLNEKWKNLKNSVFSLENVQRIAEEKWDQLQDSGAFARDRERWPDGAHADSLKELLEFHSRRLEFLDEHYTSFLEEK